MEWLLEKWKLLSGIAGAFSTICLGIWYAFVFLITPVIADTARVTQREELELFNRNLSKQADRTAELSGIIDKQKTDIQTLNGKADTNRQLLENQNELLLQLNKTLLNLRLPAN